MVDVVVTLPSCLLVILIESRWVPPARLTS
jgi:hypothetical protein